MGLLSSQELQVNPISNAILEWIHQVLGNLVRDFNIKYTYAEGDDR